MSEKAVSQVLSALLLIALAVAASVLFYSYTMGLLGELETHGGTGMKDMLILEAYDWTTLASVRVTLRNVGSTTVIVSAIYLNGQPVTFTNPMIPIGGTSTLTFTAIAGMVITSGQAYALKVATMNGGQFAFQIVAGTAG